MEIVTNRSRRHWWAFVIRGVLFIALGIYMMCQLTSSFIALGFLFGLTIFLAGLAELIRVTRELNVSSRQWHLMLGIIDIILGIILMGHVAASMAILRIIWGLWFVFGGIYLFIFSRQGGRSLLMMAGAILIIVFGLMVMFNATFGDKTIILWTAVAIMITGLFNLILGLGLRRILK